MNRRGAVNGAGVVGLEVFNPWVRCSARPPRGWVGKERLRFARPLSCSGSTLGFPGVTRGKRCLWDAPCGPRLPQHPFAEAGLQRAKARVPPAGLCPVLLVFYKLHRSCELRGERGRSVIRHLPEGPLGEPWQQRVSLRCWHPHCWGCAERRRLPWFGWFFHSSVTLGQSEIDFRSAAKHLMGQWG